MLINSLGGLIRYLATRLVRPSLDCGSRTQGCDVFLEGTRPVLMHDARNVLLEALAGHFPAWGRESGQIQGFASMRNVSPTVLLVSRSAFHV